MRRSRMMSQRENAVATRREGDYRGLESSSKRGAVASVAHFAWLRRIHVMDERHCVRSGTDGAAAVAAHSSLAPGPRRWDRTVPAMFVRRHPRESEDPERAPDMIGSLSPPISRG